MIQILLLGVLIACCWVSFQAGREFELKKYLRVQTEEIKERYRQIYGSMETVYSKMFEKKGNQ